MQKKNFLLLSAASLMLLSSCSKLGPLSADNFTVTPNPLETQTGTVPATINGHFPEKYMKKKAVVTVIPELRYSNGQISVATPPPSRARASMATTRPSTTASVVTIR